LLNHHKNEIARFKKQQDEDKHFNKQKDQRYVNTEPDILHVEQSRFSQNIKGRLDRTGKITEFFSKESPIKTLALATDSKSKSLERIVNRNVQKEKQRRDAYEIGIAESRKKETCRMKDTNLDLIGQK